MESVYIITNKSHRKDNLFKVGHHKGNRKKLLRRYGTQLPNPDILRFQDSKQNTIDEKALHRILKKYKYKGEWFEIEEYKLLKIFDDYFDGHNILRPLFEKFDQFIILNDDPIEGYIRLDSMDYYIKLSEEENLKGWIEAKYNYEYNYKKCDENCDKILYKLDDGYDNDDEKIKHKVIKVRVDDVCNQIVSKYYQKKIRWYKPDCYEALLSGKSGTRVYSLNFKNFTINRIDKENVHLRPIDTDGGQRLYGFLQNYNKFLTKQLESTSMLEVFPKVNLDKFLTGSIKKLKKFTRQLIFGENHNTTYIKIRNNSSSRLLFSEFYSRLYSTYQGTINYVEGPFAIDINTWPDDYNKNKNNWMLLCMHENDYDSDKYKNKMVIIKADKNYDIELIESDKKIIINDNEDTEYTHDALWNKYHISILIELL